MSNQTTQKAWNGNQGEGDYENGRFLGQITTVASNQTNQSIRARLNLPSSTNSLLSAEDLDETRDCTIYQDLLMKDGKFTIIATSDQIPTKFQAFSNKHSSYEELRNNQG